jgi:hypothetical protein
VSGGHRVLSGDEAADHPLPGLDVLGWGYRYDHQCLYEGHHAQSFPRSASVPASSLAVCSHSDCSPLFSFAADCRTRRWVSYTWNQRRRVRLLGKVYSIPDQVDVIPIHQTDSVSAQIVPALLAARG